VQTVTLDYEGVAQAYLSIRGTARLRSQKVEDMLHAGIQVGRDVRRHLESLCRRHEVLGGQEFGAAAVECVVEEREQRHVVDRLRMGCSHFAQAQAQVEVGPDLKLVGAVAKELRVKQGPHPKTEEDVWALEPLVQVGEPVCSSLEHASPTLEPMVLALHCGSHWLRHFIYHHSTAGGAVLDIVRFGGVLELVEPILHAVVMFVVERFGDFEEVWMATRWLPSIQRHSDCRQKLTSNLSTETGTLSGYFSWQLLQLQRNVSSMTWRHYNIHGQPDSSYGVVRQRLGRGNAGIWAAFDAAREDSGHASAMQRIMRMREGWSSHGCRETGIG
jgi:hypothetical protein